MYPALVAYCLGSVAYAEQMLAECRKERVAMLKRIKNKDLPEKEFRMCVRHIWLYDGMIVGRLDPVMLHKDHCQFEREDSTPFGYPPKYFGK